MNASAKVGAIVALLLVTIACGETKKESRIDGNSSRGMPPAICGNSEVEAGETCDDGNTETEACAYGLDSCTVCDSNCQSVEGAPSFCGDGIIDEGAGEACDDGNSVEETCEYGQTICTVCNSSCQLVEGATSYCGDGVSDTDNGEFCDDGFRDACGTCNSNCSAAGEGMTCGDGTVCPEAETCDDGNQIDGDGCDSSCRQTGCGSGVITDGELCDDGNTEDWDLCSADCQKITDVENYDNCSPDGSYQSDCQGYTHCIPWEGENICVPPCEGEGDLASCGTGRACAGLPFGANDTRFYCLPLASLRDEACLSNLQLCAAGQGTCMSTNYSQTDGPTDFRCKLACDGGFIGEQGSCPPDEICAQNSAGYVDIYQDDTGSNVACLGEEEGECPAQYECINFANGAKYCAKWIGWCGSLTPLCGQLDYYGRMDCIDNKPCNDREGHSVCGIPGDVENPAVTICYDYYGLGSMCVGLCEQDGVSLDCGEGYVCRQPPSGQQMYYDLQEDGPEPCSATADCADGYNCLSFTGLGLRCGRPAKMCLYEDKEFELCDFLEDGSNSCESGLECISINGGNPQCMKPCDLDTDGSCGDNTCMDFEVTAGEVTGLCVEANATRDALCRINLKACGEGAGDCVPTHDTSVNGDVTEYRCKVVCDASEIGSQGSCGDGESCFPAGYELNDSVPVGWCGVGVAPCGRMDAEGIAECVQNQRCNIRSGHDYCSVDSTGTTAVTASQCVGVAGGSICVAQCETDAEDTTCGDDFQCKAPSSEEALLSELQEGAPSCSSDEACDTASGFSCYQVDNESVCARPLRVCLDKDPICGNDVSEYGEGCDDGNLDDGDGCDSNCTPTGCGNDITTSGEDCDTSGNSATCDADCTVPECGDGFANPEAGEACDASGESTSCDIDCTAVVCGDGVTNAAAGEKCDDGDVVSENDACSANCSEISFDSGVVFAGLSLEGWDFSQQNLSARDFTGSYFTRANFTQANLRGAIFTGAFGLDTAVWEHAYYDALTVWPTSFDPQLVDNLYLIGPTAQLSAANLTNADLSNADLSGAMLTDADLSGATLTGATLSGATLNDADLSGATLTNAILSDASLVDADLSGADLSGADLSNATLTNVNWTDAICPNGTPSSDNGGTCG